MTDDSMQNATLAFAEKTNMTDDSMQNATLAFAEKKKHD
jgi:hypothetical protein